MPLCVLTGFPAAGKTQIAVQLAEYLSVHCPQQRVVLVGDAGAVAGFGAALPAVGDEDGTEGLTKERGAGAASSAPDAVEAGGERRGDDGGDEATAAEAAETAAAAKGAEGGSASATATATARSAVATTSLPADALPASTQPLQRRDPANAGAPPDSKMGTDWEVQERNTVFVQADAEKKARGCLLVSGDALGGEDRRLARATQCHAKQNISALIAQSAVERLLRPDTTVIVDGLNYIKGLRYELFCLSRTHKTPYCLVHVATSAASSCQRNAACRHYTPALHSQLVARYECPDPSKRWDKPLFVIAEADQAGRWGESNLNCGLQFILLLRFGVFVHHLACFLLFSSSLTTETVQQVFGEVVQALVGQAAPKAHRATRAAVEGAPDLVTVLDAYTRDIVKHLQQAQAQAVAGDELQVPHASTKVRLARTVGMPELRRLRQQFLSFARVHVMASTEVADNFVHFLNASWSVS